MVITVEITIENPAPQLKIPESSVEFVVGHVVGGNGKNLSAESQSECMEAGNGWWEWR